MSGKDHFRKCWAQQPVYSGGPVAAIVPEGAAAKAAGAPGLLAMAFGCTLNLMRASDGATVASFDSPLEEDVLLHVAGTGRYPEAAAAAALAEGDDDAPAAGPSTTADAADATGESGPSPAEVICGSVAFSTESRQIFALRVTLDTYTDKYSLTVVKSWTAAQHAIACLRFSPDGAHLASGATDGGLRVWDVHHHHVTHNYRGKGGIVTFVAFAAGGHLMAAGTVEGYVSVIDFETKAVIASSRASNSAFEAASFLPDDSLACIGRDRRVAVFEPRTLKERKAIVLRDHVASAAFATAEDFFIGSPDGVIAQCRLAANGSVSVRSRTAPIAAATEAENAIRAIAFLPRSALFDGMALDASADAEADADANDDDAPTAKQHRAEASAEDELPLIVAADGSQRLHFITPLAPSAPSVAFGLKTEKVLCGYLDQIFDVKLLPAPTAAKDASSKPAAGGAGDDDDDEAEALGDLEEPPKPAFARVVATNSKDVMVFNDGGCELSGCLAGHTDIVTALDVSADGNFIATGSKDESMRLWRIGADRTSFTCVGLGEGHDGPVTAVAMNPKMATSSSFVVVSVGSDEAIKLWDARKPSADTADSKKRWVPVQTTVNAHLGAVHCVAIAPNDAVVATGGKDKTVNLWTLKAKGLTKLGGFAGHRRAITSLSFAPADRLLISSSNDGCIKVWSLGTMSCARTLQHDKVGVAQARFFNGGHQIVSANAHGIVRVWAVAASEVVNTFEAHTDRVWTLAVAEAPDATHIVTGGADSCIVAYEDYTAEAVQQMKSDKADFILMTQKLQNAVRRKDWATAVKIALKLKHPRHLRMVIVSWLADDETQCEDGLTDILAVASHGDLFKMLEFTRTWIANSRHCNVAAVVIAALLRAHHFTALRKMAAVKETIEALVGYNKRHEARVAGVLDQMHYVDYITRSLRPIGTVTAAAPEVEKAKPAATASKAANKRKGGKKPVRAREE